MCVKVIGPHARECRPHHHTCPSDMEVCRMVSAPHTSLVPHGAGGYACHDTLGKWQRLKCAKKVRKNKCGKRRVKLNCRMSCNQC